MLLTYTFGTPVQPAASGPVAQPERPRIARRTLEILRACATEWDIAAPLLTGQRRQAYIAEARHAAMALMRAEGLALAEIAAPFHRDHSSVIHALKRHRQRLASPRYAAKIERVRGKLAS